MKYCIEYRFGFNGKENVDEVYGVTGSFQDYGMRDYDTRIARFIKVDPLTKSYPWYTPYQFAGNKPIWAVDLDGLEEQNYFIKMLMDFLFGPQGLTNEEDIKESVGNKNYIQKKVDDYNKKVEQIKKVGKTSAKITGDVIMITGGVVAIGASGGTATPVVAAFLITSGTFSTAAGTTKLILDIAGEEQLSDKVTGSFIDATVGQPAEIIVGGEEGQKVRGTIKIIEDVVTFEPESVEDLYKAYSINEEIKKTFTEEKPKVKQDNEKGN